MFNMFHYLRSHHRPTHGNECIQRGLVIGGPRIAGCLALLTTDSVEGESGLGDGFPIGMAISPEANTGKTWSMKVAMA